jgi:hypothetical protein
LAERWNFKSFFIFSLFIGAFIVPIANGSSQAIWQSKVPPDLQGRVFSARRLIAWFTNPISPIIAGVLADQWLEPSMTSGTTGLSHLFEPLVGNGPGAGMALLFVLCGVLAALVGIVGYFIRPIRDADSLLPDHDQLEKVAENLEVASSGLREPTGLVKRLLDPKGSVATILDDDNALYNQIAQSLAELNAVIGQLAAFTRFVNTTQPQILSLLEQGRVTLDQGQDVLEAVKNNPLLRGGVPARREQQTTFQSYRDEDF